MDECILYVVKIDQCDNCNYFEPCSMCTKIIKKYKVGKVVCCI